MPQSIYPSRISLMPPGFVVRRQTGNKCQSFTIANIWDILRARAGSLTSVGTASIDALYYDATKRAQGLTGDVGASFWHLERSLQLYGVATVPWSDGGHLGWNPPPPPSVVESAAANKPVVFRTIPYISQGVSTDDLDETIAMLLSSGNPVAITMLLSSNFWDIYYHSNYETARYTYNPSDFRGEHALLIVGRDLEKGIYEVLNSYGPDYGAGGRISISFADLRKCVDLHWYIAQCPIPLVPEFNIMSNPIPTSLTAPQFAGYEAAVIAELRRVYNLNSWPGVLGTGALLKLSDKQVEMYAPALDGGPGHGIPRYIIQSLINSGGIQPVTGLRMETSA